MCFHLLRSKHAAPPAPPEFARPNSNTEMLLSLRLEADSGALDADASRKEASLEICDNGCCFINKQAPTERFLTQHMKTICRHSRERLVKGWRDQKRTDTKLVLATHRWEKPCCGGAGLPEAGGF